MFKFILLFLLPLSAFSLDFKVENPCSDDYLIDEKISVEAQVNLADLTLDILAASNIPFDANISGVKSIANSPQGLDAMDVLSDAQMKAYGWCYEVDGVLSKDVTYEQLISSENKSVTWYYGFAFYSSGLWYKYCNKDKFESFYCK